MVKKFAGYLRAELIGAESSSNNLAIYENIENIPDVEVTLEKVLDGYPLIYHLCTQGSDTITLAGRSTTRCQVALGVWGDTKIQLLVFHRLRFVVLVCIFLH